jgi:hypothetical protein
LENVLTINPNNERAKQGLQLLTNKSSAPESAKSASTLAEDVLASTSFTPLPGPKTEANPFNLNADDDELPSSIEWDAPPAPPTATSSASSSYRVAEPSAAEYDAWVSNLNLGSNTAAEDEFKTNSLDAAAQFMSTPFDDDEEDLFSSGPFSAAETSLPITIDTPPPVKTSPPMTARSTSIGSRTEDSLLDEIEDDDLFGTAFDQDDDDEDELTKLDAAEFFQYIPKDIQATRLPGTRERYPALVIIGFLAVVLLNVGAVAMLVMNLTAQ